MKKLSHVFNHASRKAKYILVTTPIEIAIGAVLFSGAAGVLSHHHYAEQAGQIPVAYSGIQKTLDGGDAGPLTQFYASNNNAAMMVFQSNDDAFKAGNSDQAFADALRRDTQAVPGEHASLADIANAMPSDTGNALAGLKDEAHIRDELQAIQRALDNSWSSWHFDHYHTEVYTTESCTTSNGSESCTTEVHTRQVYDYTSNTFTYHPDQGQLAVSLLQQFMKNHPDLSVGETLQLAKKLSDYNKGVIDASRGAGASHLTDDQYLGRVNTWALGSNYSASQPKVESGYATLKNDAASLAGTLGTAHSTYTITYGYWDRGPAEYQLSNTTYDMAKGVNDAASNIVDGIRFSGTAVPELKTEIQQYIDVVLNHKKGDAGQLRSDIMKKAEAIYDRNDGNGFDVHTMKWLNVFLFALAGLAVGIGLGEGANILFGKEKEKWVREYEEEVAEDREEEREEEEEKAKAKAARENGDENDNTKDTEERDTVYGREEEKEFAGTAAAESRRPPQDKTGDGLVTSFEEAVARKNRTAAKKTPDADPAATAEKPDTSTERLRKRYEGLTGL